MSEQEPIIIENIENMELKRPEDIRRELKITDNSPLIVNESPNNPIINGEVSVTRPRGFWNSYENIEIEARRAIEGGIKLTHKTLIASGLSSLDHAINKKYPGGYQILNQNIGNDSQRRENKWYEDPETIRKEVQALMDKGIIITAPELRSSGHGDLSSAINSHYPGGMFMLRMDLGLPIGGKREKIWNEIKNIEQEVQKAIEGGFAINQESLIDNGFGNLANDISTKYPGGMFAIRRKLGLEIVAKHPDGFWKNPQNIDDEARKVLSKGLKLTQGSLRDAGLSSFGRAITLNYKGGYSALREKLGLNEPQIYPDQADEMMRGLEVLP